MASESGTAVHALSELLQKDPARFSFFRAVWLLERITPGSAKLGHNGPASREAVRLRPTSTLAFPNADVDEVVLRGDRRGYAVTSSILGLYGASSPMPGFYTADIIQRDAADGVDVGQLLLDILNHRLMSLLYRSWLKYRWQYEYEPGGRDATSRLFLGLTGLAHIEAGEDSLIPRERLLRYVGTLTQHPRNAAAAAAVLGDYFELDDAVLEQCVARRVEIPEADQTVLGRRNARLGQSVIVGRTILDRTGKVRLRLGPLSTEEFQRLCPGGPDFAPLCELARIVLPDVLLFDVHMVLEREAARPVRLSSRGESRLGWDSWLTAPEPAPDSEADPGPLPEVTFSAARLTWATTQRPSSAPN